MSTVLLSLCRAHTHSVLAFCKHAERTLSSTSRSEGACASLKTYVCVHVCECVYVPVGAIEVLCFIYFEHMLSKYQASRAKGWLFQQLCDVNSSRHRYSSEKNEVCHRETLETDWRSMYSYAMHAAYLPAQQTGVLQSTETQLAQPLEPRPLVGRAGQHFTNYRT